MKRKVTYNLFNCFKALKGIFTFCLLLSLLAKPIISVIFHIADIEYEICESYEKTDSEEKEDTTESEEEDTKPYYYSISASKFHSNYKSFLFTFQKDLISSHLDIPFPPPDKC